ncbi:hypothetical protein G7Z17_g10074 [Cylindrodendrum hubeiense]|uniref:TM7S3/TM198-like domain-containing protein n=1 Tax=Cylindrodendrum hubeiense TaxID=595255 RepID=A0A9P5H3R6_9HYPO|nr:hypothetical protein G7Z17_g10074 [Cylindrodendrum hubeiense]
MLPRWSRLWALLCLFLVIQLVSAESFRIAYRRDDKASSETAVESKTTTKESKATGTADSSDEATTDAAESTGKDHKSVTVTTTTKAKTTKNSEASATSTIITSDGTLDNSTFVNVTIADGQLPIDPKITPGWGVAGVIMLLTGITHTLIGIKNRWIHTFFSTAYVAALGVAVLIVYVMNVPVSNALQGGYVVAVVMSGCALGAASMFFRELLEGLGCALGGFCVSMWLMCLVSGGLLKAVAPKAIFISCFTLVGFVFYCSRYTRDWALIIMIAFTGATVTVLGIDCFSRAGLKEFWAWNWDLNNNLFPLGADTYPVTKGIRVETAAIIIIFLVGVVSQIKLWKIVREQREKRAEELAQGQRNLQEEEENVGRNIEEANTRERRQWERTYGNGEGSSTVSRNSETGDEVCEKKLRSSHTGSSQRQSSSVEVIEMTDMADPLQPPKPAAANLMATEHDTDGRVTVRVAQDDYPSSPSIREMNEKLGDDQSSTFVGLEDDRRVSRATRFSQSPAPEVVPLPFVVPATDDAHSEADRSSVATFADDDEGQPPTPGARHSIAQRLSRLSYGSAELLRNLSQRSVRPHGDFPQDQYRSTDELVIPGPRPRDDDGSMAATVDDESISAGDRGSLALPQLPKSIEITAELSDRDMLSPTLGEQAKVNDSDAKSIANRSRADPSEQHASEAQSKAKSTASAASTRVSLTKDRLPRSLSRVALSYRTNEWAKHLSSADAPDFDEININEPRAQESPAPVHMAELQKAAGEGTPAPAVTRSDSYASNMSHSASKRATKQHVPAALAILTGDGQNRSPGNTPTSAGMPRSSSTGLRRTSGGGFEPIAEERDAYVRATPPIPEEVDQLRTQSTSPSPLHSTDARRSITPGLVSYSSPQTLIGQREMVIRNKSQGNLVASTSDLNLYRASSDAGSLHNYAMYASGVGADADDLPLSQRKQLMRHNSLNPSLSTPSLARLSGGYEANSPEIPFDSHQPQRVSTVPTPAAREAALSHFRQTVAHDLRSGTPVINSPGRETPFTPMSLLGGREAEVQRNIEMGRNILMGQKEAEAQRREKEQRQKEWNDRVFDERMRSGDLLEVHREAMRKMQKHAKKG